MYSAKSEELNACTYVQKKLEEFRHEARYTDVTILVDGRTFKCHRVILAAVSPYFDAMLDGRFVESGKGELTVSEIDSESFEAILLYAYTGRQPAIDESKKLLNLLRTSQFLQVQNIQEECILYILTNMGKLTNVIEILMFADATNIPSLVNPLRKYISENFVNFSQSNEFLEMSFYNLWEVVNLHIEHSSSPVLKNDNLFADGLVRWLSCDYNDRKDHIRKFSSVMRSKKISPEYVEFVDRHYGMQYCVSEEWLRPKSGTLFNSFALSNENSTISSYGDYQFSRGESLSLHLFSGNVTYSINKFKPNGLIVCNEDLDWKNLVSVVSDESSYLYCLKKAGFYNSQTFYANSSVTMSASTSRILCPPPVYIESGVGYAFQKKSNCIYYYNSAIRRYGKNHLSSEDHSLFDKEFQFFCYNVEMNKWLPVLQTGFKNNICFASLVVHDDLVYVVSKYYVQAYDYRSSQWLDLPRKPHDDGSVSSCSLNGKIYVDDGKYIEVFDPVASKWDLTPKRENNAYSVLYYTIPKLVAFENLLWRFVEVSLNCIDRFSFYIGIYSPDTDQWYSPPLALDVDAISAKCCVKKSNPDFIKFITVFKSDRIS